MSFIQDEMSARQRCQRTDMKTHAKSFYAGACETRIGMVPYLEN